MLDFVRYNVELSCMVPELKKWLIIGVLIISMLSMGCEKVLVPSEEVIIQILDESYRPGDTVRIRITNPTDFAIYLRRCGASSFRYSAIMTGEGDDIIVKNDSCSSFNQQIIEIRGGNELDITLMLTLDAGVRLTPSENLTLKLRLHMFDTMRQMIDPPKNQTNSFKLQL